MSEIERAPLAGEIETPARPLTVAELIAQLLLLPQDLPVIDSDYEWERVAARVVDVDVDRYLDGRLYRFGWTDDYEMRTHPDAEYAKAVQIEAS
ncbi:hypothetical protein [Gordonia rubripertincta]|uniref:hypothetical protein n=1 Tax=Gordonia rubripertincta TaxID=36822 RepID=UPI0015FACE3C|nr:hypothetical protein [Gordonia rubripertincta]QMU22518.1 hypothetical protein H3V45_08640 [Gordonia rubripertincta]